jgi:hypothetical protein
MLPVGSVAVEPTIEPCRREVEIRSRLLALLPAVMAAELATL